MESSAHPELLLHLRKLLGDGPGEDAAFQRLVRHACAEDSHSSGADAEPLTFAEHVVVAAVAAEHGMLERAAENLAAASAQQERPEGPNAAAFLYAGSRVSLAQGDLGFATDQLVIAVQEELVPPYLAALFDALVAAGRLSEAADVQRVGQAHFPDDEAFARPVGSHSQTRPESVSFVEPDE